jgi:hypothetical protein
MIDAKQLVAAFERARSDRSQWETHWQDLAYYLLPSHQFTQKTTAGSKLRGNIVSSMAPLMAERLAAALHGWLTNPATKWFGLGVQNDRVTQALPEVHKWLEAARDATLSVYNDQRTEFNTAMYEAYLELVVFSTAVIYRETTDDLPLRFMSLPLSECYLVENSRRKIDKIYRLFQLSADQAVEMFGDKAVAAKKLVDANNGNDKLEFIHYVGPRKTDMDSAKTGDNKAFESRYICLKDKTEARDPGGYDRFPFYCPRWSRAPGETYGRGPGMTLLPDIKQVNKIVETLTRAAELNADPPWAVPDDGFALPLRMGPGAINWQRIDLGRNSAYPMVSGSQPQLAEWMAAQVADSIRQGFYDDILKLPEVDRMTTVEVYSRRQDRQQIMSPVVSRLFVELLSPIVLDSVMVLIDRAVIPPAPAQLQDKLMEVGYDSPLASSQRAGESQAIEQTMAKLTMLAQQTQNPDILDNANIDFAAEQIIRLNGASSDLLRRKQDRDLVRKQRQEQAIASAAMGVK